MRGKCDKVGTCQISSSTTGPLRATIARWLRVAQVPTLTSAATGATSGSWTGATAVEGDKSASLKRSRTDMTATRSSDRAIDDPRTLGDVGTCPGDKPEEPLRPFELFRLVLEPPVDRPSS